MSGFNLTISDMLETMRDGGSQATLGPIPSSESPQSNSVAVGASIGGFFGILVFMVVILVALRRRLDVLADLSDRIVTALEALCWRQGTSVPSDAPLEATTRVKLPARNLTDDEAIEMRRIHSSCPDQRPGCEYV